MSVIISVEGNCCFPSTLVRVGAEVQHGVCVCVIIVCQWCRTVAITSRQRGPPSRSLSGSGGQMCRIHQTHTAGVTGETHTLWMRDGRAGDATPRSTVQQTPPTPHHGLTTTHPLIPSFSVCARYTYFLRLMSIFVVLINLVITVIA